MKQKFIQAVGLFTIVNVVVFSVAIVGLIYTMSYGEMKINKPTDAEFYVYKNRGDRANHFVASGWMGDFGDLKFNQGYYPDAMDRSNTCIKVTYSAEKKQGAGWTGIYWQCPANNWGDKKGGYDLSGYSKVTFKVRGDKGTEFIDKFMVGGISGITEDGDSDAAESEPIELSTEWKLIEIPLKGLDMRKIIGGFGFAINSEMNEKGAAFYIDEIKYVK